METAGRMPFSKKPKASNMNEQIVRVDTADVLPANHDGAHTHVTCEIPAAPDISAMFEACKRVTQHAKARKND